MIRISKKHSRKGFTLSELMIGVLVLTPILIGTLATFIRSNDLNDVSANSSFALNALTNQLTVIENTEFSQLINLNNTTFTITGLDGIGVVNVDNSDPQLITVRLSFSWQEKNGRLIGEDLNLNGVLNAGEDSNGNGRLDSPVMISTLISETDG